MGVQDKAWRTGPAKVSTKAPPARFGPVRPSTGTGRSWPLVRVRRGPWAAGSVGGRG